MTDEVVPVEGQVPAWTDEDEARLRVRASRLTAAHPASMAETLEWLTGGPLLSGYLVRFAASATVNLLREKRSKCSACGLRRVLYVIGVGTGRTPSKCWACWSGGKF